MSPRGLPAAVESALACFRGGVFPPSRVAGLGLAHRADLAGRDLPAERVSLRSTALLPDRTALFGRCCFDPSFGAGDDLLRQEGMALAGIGFDRPGKCDGHPSGKDFWAVYSGAGGVMLISELAHQQTENNFV